MRKTFTQFIKDCWITKEKGNEVIAHSIVIPKLKYLGYTYWISDLINFCETVWQNFGINYTLQQAVEIYETAPLND